MSTAVSGIDVINRVPEEDGGEQLLFWCPGCGCGHGPGHGAGAGPRWTWNGDVVRPVLSPSLVVQWSDASGERRCHSFIGCNGAEPGQIIFLADSTHELAGKTVPLTPWKDA